MEYNHITYMQAIAENIRDIAHTPKKPRFFTSTGISSLEGVFSNLNSLTFPCLIAEDNCDSRLADNLSDSIREHPFFTFYVLYQASAGNDEEILKARSDAKTTARKILSRMLRDAKYLDWDHEMSVGLRIMDFSSVRIQGVGPLGDTGHGVMVTFTLQQEADIDYDTNDWLDE
jgi:hypothetical protein